VVQVVVPSILAAQAGGRQRFDVEATTVGEALRALPVADLLFNERGEWSRHLNVFVDDRDARELGGPACPLAGVREVLIIPMLSGG
jgi:molybdopterin converting factor small subunit